MSLNHQFYLVSRSAHLYRDYGDLIGAPSGLLLHDDIIGYLWESLAWIPSVNPAKRSAPRMMGLCRWGPTVIEGSGAKAASAVFGAWASLFSRGPKRLRLRGAFEIKGDAPLEKGRYQTIETDRETLVDTLVSLSRHAEKVSSSRRRLYILHLGI